MSSEKRSAGKVLHYQMGFPPLHCSLFYTCSQYAHTGFDAYTGLQYIDLFVPVMHRSIMWLLDMESSVR